MSEINFSGFSEARWAGNPIVFNTDPQVCSTVEGPAWAASAVVSGYDSPCYVIESELITLGTPVLAASPMLGVYEVGVGEEREVSPALFKVCSSEEMEEPEGQEPTGRYLSVTYFSA